MEILTIHNSIFKVEYEQDDEQWHHSKFPHPLVTLDYNAEDELIGVALVITDGTGQVTSR